MIIHQLEPEDWTPALQLAWRVFMQFEAPEYSPQGVKVFCQSLNDTAYLATLTVWGAFVNGQLAGMIAINRHGQHVALLFVESQYQRSGVGGALLNQALSQRQDFPITVNSAPSAVGFYKKHGFVANGTEKCEEGIRFVPMIYQV